MVHFITGVQFAPSMGMLKKFCKESLTSWVRLKMR